MANTFHVAVYVQSIPEAVEQYRKILGIEPAKVRADYAKFELVDPPVIFSLNIGGKAGTLSHLGIRYPGTGEIASESVRAKNQNLAPFRQENTTCCYAKADKFWVRDADGIPWEMYTLLEDVEADTAADVEIRRLLGQETGLQVLAVGRLKTGPEKLVVEDYRSRAEGLGRKLGISKLTVSEFAESQAQTTSKRMDEEAELLSSVLPSKAFMIVLDERGKELSSSGFAEFIQRHLDQGTSDLAFVIGGPDGAAIRLVFDVRRPGAGQRPCHSGLI
jgi:23S rRNA pseudoU1915 N3-methylase RlmH/catechol 2,3-dioxygenase-like lactoylglutathione lyase family enzyme